MKKFRGKKILGHFSLILRHSFLLPMRPPGVGINYSLFFSPITIFLATFGRGRCVASFKSFYVCFGCLGWSCVIF